MNARRRNANPHIERTIAKDRRLGHFARIVRTTVAGAAFIACAREAYNYASNSESEPKPEQTVQDKDVDFLLHTLTIVVGLGAHNAAASYAAMARRSREVEFNVAQVALAENMFESDIFEKDAVTGLIRDPKRDARFFAGLAAAEVAALYSLGGFAGLLARSPGGPRSGAVLVVGGIGVVGIIEFIELSTRKKFSEVLRATIDDDSPEE